MSSTAARVSHASADPYDLACRIRHGDAAAEARFVAAYREPVGRFLRERCRDPFLIEDLQQETLRVVLVRLRRRGLIDPGRLPGFVRRTARNLWVAECRKAGRRQTYTGHDGFDAVAGPGDTPLHDALRREAADRVRTMIRQLRHDRDRQLLNRFYLAEEDRGAICTDLGLSRQHFNRVLHRARRRLRDLVERTAKRELLLQTA